MGRKYKAYTVEYMPNLVSREDQLDFFQKVYGCNQERANRLLHIEEEILKRDPKRSRLRRDKDTGALRGRNTRTGEAIFGKPTEGGKDNLRNFLTTSIGERYLTTSEVEVLLESKYGEDEVETKFKRARDKKRQILDWHLAVRRWSKWGMPTPDPADFELAIEEGKYAERLGMYGFMPRGLKHKPGEKYVPEESQVLQWMGKQSGETDFAKIYAEYNRLPWAWINSETDEKDSDYRLAKAIRVYDRGTGETIGILTYREEVKAKEEQSKEEPQASEEVEGSQTGDRYLVNDINFDTWIGTPGKRKRLDEKTHDRIVDMLRMSKRRAAAWIKEQFTSVKIDRFIEDAISDEVKLLHEHDNGDLEGIVSFDEREHDRIELEKEEREREQRKAEEEAQQKKKENPPHGWPKPEELPSNLTQKIVFQNMPEGSSRDSYERRANEFLSFYKDKWDGKLPFNAKELVQTCIDKKLIGPASKESI